MTPRSGAGIDGSRLRKRAQPAWIAPMLATLAERSPAGTGWVYEPKLDGVRCLVFARGGKITLLSRNRKPLNGAYPEIVDALEQAVRGDAILDGEVVAVDPRTKLSSFSLLQRRIGIRDADAARRSGVAVELHLFDCVFYEGLDLTGLPLIDRKSVLRDVVWFDERVRFTPFQTKGSAQMYRRACERGGEGIIAKRADSAYSGTRSTDWLKLKCLNEQELVVGGYTDPKGARHGFGALLVGYYDGGLFRYAGKVGTGFDGKTLTKLATRLEGMARRTTPFDGTIPRERDVHWVTPRMVVQVGFSEWTHEDILRHPRFIGVREDKDPKTVVREKRSTSRAGSRSASPPARA